jgi:hypothetical protein
MPIGGESDVDWPSIDDLRTMADVPSGSDHDAQLESFLAAAIAETKAKVGDWDELTDAPNDALAASALMRAFELVSDVYVPYGQRKSDDLMAGQRRRFAIG